MSLPVVEHGGGLEGWWERLSPADSLSSGAVGRIPCSKLGRCAGLTPLLSHGTESTDTGLEACWGGGPGTTVPPWGRGVGQLESAAEMFALVPYVAEGRAPRGPHEAHSGYQA